jgi:hypothetical protein
MNETLTKAVSKAATHKGYIVALIVAIVLILIYVYRDKIAVALGLSSIATGGIGASKASATIPAPSTGGTTRATTTVLDDSTALSKGMRGEKVKELQEIINKLLLARKKYLGIKANLLKVDGIFGSATEKALLEVTNGFYSKISISHIKDNYKDILK